MNGMKFNLGIIFAIILQGVALTWFSITSFWFSSSKVEYKILTLLSSFEIYQMTATPWTSTKAIIAKETLNPFISLSPRQTPV